MKSIRPVSDLRNSFADFSRDVHESGRPVFLTKNGSGDMAVEYRVEAQPLALRDMTEAVTYIANDLRNPSAASRLSEETVTVVRVLYARRDLDKHLE